MKFKISYSSKLMNTTFLTSSLIAERFLEEKIKHLDNNIFKEWTFNINIIYSSSVYDSNKISISKKITTYSNDLEFYTSIGIPIPLNTEVVWGVNKKNVSYQPKYDREKYNILFDINFLDYEDFENYKNDAIKLAINKLFENGFKVKGVKVELI